MRYDHRTIRIVAFWACVATVLSASSLQATLTTGQADQSAKSMKVGDGPAPGPLDAAAIARSFDLTGSPTIGPDDAAITVVEFSDFQCVYCARALPTMARVLREYEGKVRWVFKHNPLEYHTDAALAHRASLAAHNQGRFWQMHESIFSRQTEMKRRDLLDRAVAMGLDMKRFKSDLDSRALRSVIERDLEEGKRVGIDGTPIFFVNGERIDGVASPEEFRSVIDRLMDPVPAAPTPERLSTLERELGSGVGRFRMGQSPEDVNRMLPRPFGSVDFSVLPVASEFTGTEVRYFFVPLEHFASPESPTSPLSILAPLSPCWRGKSYIVFFFTRAGFVRLSVRLLGDCGSRLENVRELAQHLSMSPTRQRPLAYRLELSDTIATALIQPNEVSFELSRNGSPEPGPR